MKKNNILLTSVTAIIAAIGVANADIEKNAESADCDNATLGVESGPTNLEAQWEANKITLTWYDGDTQLELESEDPATECTYDGALTVPSDTLTRTGYTFDGWTVRTAAAAPAAQQCWPSNIDTSVNPREDIYGYSRLNGDEGVQESTYGLTVGSGEWVADFSYGFVKGMAKCSAKSGMNHSEQWGGNSSDWTASESELTSAGDGGYCWCKPIGFDANKGGEYCSVSASSWVYVYSSSASYCADMCGQRCVTSVVYKSGFRSALYSVIE